jgi:hypothetical protein
MLSHVVIRVTRHYFVSKVFRGRRLLPAMLFTSCLQREERMFRRHLFSVAVIACASVASISAHAVNVTFSLNGDSDTIAMSNGTDADASVDPNTDTVDLTPNVLTDVFLQGGNVDVFLVGDADGDGSFDQTLSITSPSATPSSRTLSQDIFVTTHAGSAFESPSGDVNLFGSSSLVFDLGAYTLTVTPTGGSRTNQTSSSIPFSNNSTFLLTPTPEPTCGALMIVGAGALLTRRRPK